MIAQISAPVLSFEVSDVPAVSRLATVAAVLGNSVAGAAISMGWEASIVSSRGETRTWVDLFEEGWQDILGVDDDDEIPANRALYFAAYVWLVKVANRFEELVAHGDMDYERGYYDIEWINWHRDLIKSTLQYFDGEWDFPHATSERYSGLAHGAIL